MSPRTAASLALVLSLGGCNSTGVGNPPALLQLSITRDDETDAALGGSADDCVDADAAGSGGAAAAACTGMNAEAAGMSDSAGAGNAGLPRSAIRNALLVIGSVHFLPCDPQDPESIARGPFVVDLVHGGTRPALPAVSLAPGGFCGLDVPLAPAEAPAQLVGRSIYFDGTRADGTLFRFYANVQATLRVRARAGITWGPSSQPTHSVFWALRPRQWLEPSELNELEATSAGDGTLAIDIERHPLLLRAIRARLAGRSTLYDDSNGDAAFDAADRDAALGYGIPDAD